MTWSSLFSSHRDWANRVFNYENHFLVVDCLIELRSGLHLLQLTYIIILEGFVLVPVFLNTLWEARVYFGKGQQRQFITRKLHINELGTIINKIISKNVKKI